MSFPVKKYLIIGILIVKVIILRVCEQIAIITIYMFLSPCDRHIV